MRRTASALTGVLSTQRKMARPPGPTATSKVGSVASRASAGRSSFERRREPRDRRRRLLGAGPALEVDGAAEQQALACPGHRHVEDPVLLLRFPLPSLAAELLVVERGARTGAVEAHEANPDALALDEQLRRLGPRLAAEVGEAHDRELEPLRGVNGHQPHRIRLDALDGRVGLDRDRFPQVFDVVEERAQVSSFLGFEAACQAQQLVDVGQPALAPVEREDVIAIAAGVDAPARSARRSSAAATAVRSAARRPQKPAQRLAGPPR